MCVCVCVCVCVWCVRVFEIASERRLWILTVLLFRSSQKMYFRIKALVLVLAIILCTEVNSAAIEALAKKDAIPSWPAKQLKKRSEQGRIVSTGKRDQGVGLWGRSLPLKPKAAFWESGLGKTNMDALDRM